MAEEQTQVVAEETQQQATPSESERLQSMVFGEAPTEQQQAVVEEKKDAVTEESKPAEQQSEEEILDDSDYLKREFGWDSREVALSEIKTLREKAGKSFDYKNEDSRKVAEWINEGTEGIKKLYQHLDTQFRVEKLATADLSNKNIAAELVKFGIKNDNKDANLSDDEVDFIFNERFSIPREPVQRDDDTEDEFKEKHLNWQQQRDTIEKRLVIEAKMQQPKLAQLKSELVLPEIKKEISQTQKEVNQKDLDDFKKECDTFFQTAQQTAEKFNGFSVQVKDKDVDYSVSYTPSQEEKSLVIGKLKHFADNGLNANALLADRWLAQDGSVNIDQVQKDLFQLYAQDKISQKIATDSAAKRLEAYLKEKKQVDVNGMVVKGTFSPSNNQTEMDRLREAMLRI